MTPGATHGRDFGCYHSLRAVPWVTPRAFRFAMYSKMKGVSRLASSWRQQQHQQALLGPGLDA